EHTQATPLTRVADCARPESNTAREFTFAVDRLLGEPPAMSGAHPGRARRPGGLTSADTNLLREQLLAWQAAGLEAAELFTMRALLGRESAPVARSLADASAVGLEALDALSRGITQDAAWREARMVTLERAAKPHDAIQLPALGAIRRLVTAAAP
ncbi:MAG TPA: hypothetical protein VGD81_01855, partial [Opitutaceae bacterium]